MPTWRQLKNIITEKDSIGTKIEMYPSGPATLYLFLCPICKKEVAMRKKHIPYSTGRCKKHSQMMKPFEASYGALRNSSRLRGINFNISYEDYLEFTKNENCYYCDDKIKWEPYNEHGKNNPAFFLDRVNNDLGYLKSNCVVCCSRCNLSKRNSTLNDFISMAIKIARKHRVRLKKGSCG